MDYSVFSGWQRQHRPVSEPSNEDHGRSGRLYGLWGLTTAMNFPRVIFSLPLYRTLDGMTHVHTAVDDAEPRSLAAPRRRL